MLTGIEMGYLGGIVGSLIGVVGGFCGTYYSVRNTKGPLERRFMIKASAVMWVTLSVFLGLLIGLPTPYRFIMWVPYGLFLPIGISYVNNRQKEIQAGELCRSRVPDSSCIIRPILAEPVPSSKK